MKFILYHPVHFESWDWRAAERGIGGSETNQIEMAWRLARRGHEVISYAPIPDDCDPKWRGTEWRHIDKVDFTEDGIWIIYRSPDTADRFEPSENREFWLMCQDEDYPSFTEERASKFKKVMPLCQAHARNLVMTKPYLADKIWITSNGVKVDLIRQMPKDIERNPYRIMYASSPDRGLYNLLKIFKKAKEFVPQLELHAFYGFNNIDKLIEYNPQFSSYKDKKEQILKEMEQDGVYFHGRVPQRQLYEEWLKSGLWVYPTNFRETSAITCMESQSLGAVPITNPWWALGENVHHGIFIQGDAEDRLTQARYVGEIVRLTTNLPLQEKIRNEMMMDAQCKHNWERIVDQWEAEIYGFSDMSIAQFNFQKRFARGKILNIGCASDPGNFKKLGAINVDVLEIDPNGIPNKADIIADVRNLPESLYDCFDSVILGEVLEHLSYEDGLIAIANCKQSLNENGKLIITCPSDNRGLADNRQYTGNSYCQHRYIAENELKEMVSKSDMIIEYQEMIDYTHFTGWGIVCY